MAYQAVFFYLPVRTILQHSIPTASSVVILTEQVSEEPIRHLFLAQQMPIHAEHLVPSIRGSLTFSLGFDRLG